MNRNVSIVVILLVLAVIAGYLVWIRSRYQQPVSPRVEEEIQVIATASPIPTASASATPGGKEATGSVKQKTGTGTAVEK
jgi:cytoskeletal protein RodZ